MSDSQKVLVLSKKPCVQCDATFRFLDSHNISYQVRDVYSEEYADLISELGYLAAPIVLIYSGDELVHSWFGYNPGELDKLK